MNLVQSFGIALDMLRLHKLRAFLTMLGVIIGVMSVTLIIMISNGFQAYINTEFKKLGADTMFVFFDPSRMMRGENTPKDKLTSDDLAWILERVRSVDIGCAMVQVPSKKVRFGSLDVSNPTIYGTDQNFLELNRFGMVMGRGLTEEDVRTRANVAVIGEDIRDQLFAGKNPLGQLILLEGIALEVVGVVKKEEFMGGNTGKNLLVPITTVQDKWIGGNRIDYIMLRPKPGIPVAKAMEDVWQSLMILTKNKPIFRLDSRDSILAVFNGILGGAGLVLSAIAALSLLVGGIGIMNIMLVSVTERTKEIGLRKSVGAKQASILAQFLVEAATLSLVGGLIGMAMAWVLGQGVRAVTIAQKIPSEAGLAMPFPMVAAIGAAIFSALIGVVFGLYPAVAAARLDPIVALRRE
jgi:putative ABC transport system permease protein